jgi:hypothetical protein
MRRDPRLAFLIGPGSESFDLLTADYAAALDIPVERVRADFQRFLPDWHGEMLEWHDAYQRKPAIAKIVLCWNAGAAEFLTGYWDGTAWIGCKSGGRVQGVTNWAEPMGPR